MSTTLNTNESLNNLDGEPITRKDQDGNDVTLTVGRISANAVLGLRGYGNPAQQYSLGTRLWENDEVELTDEDVSLLEDALSREDVGYSALLTGQILDKLEQ